jgi:hypothetical protein
VIRLAGQLTAGGGREALVRLLLTAAGMALAVTLLLSAAVAFPALHAHDVRGAWTQTSPHNERPAQDERTTDPLRWAWSDEVFEGRDIVRVDLAALGPRAPVPPGLARLPGPGEIAVSPALGRLLDRTPRDELRDRFPGRVTATVGHDALQSPDDLVAFVGRTPAELARPDGLHQVVTVRSIESAPISRGLTREMRVVFVVGGVGLLLPVIVFVATATRLAAARREQRLAAMRLAGATQRQVATIAAVEAGLAAVAGTMAGLAVFLALRPSLAHIPLDGAAFYPGDLRLTAARTLAIVLGVPALAVAAALVSLRRIRISPLGVTRREAPRRATPRPLLLVVVGLAGLAGVVVWSNHDHDVADMVLATAVAVPFVVTIAGIVLAGPWLTVVVARGVARVGRRAPALLAARRLQDNPAAGFRAISGVILAVFVGTVFSGLAASILGQYRPEDGPPMAPGVVAAAPNPLPPADQRPPAPGRMPTTRQLPTWPTLTAARAAQVVADLGRVAGVDRVVTAHALPADPDVVRAALRPGGAKVFAPVVMRCADVAALGLGDCRGTTLLDLGGMSPRASGTTIPLSAAEVDRLPVVAVAAVTGGPAALERARTVLERDMPFTEGLTAADLARSSNAQLRTIQRVANIGLTATLVIAGCSLAVAVAGGIVERKRPFALLRLAGTQLGDLRRIVLTEAAAPLLMVTAASVALGFLASLLVLKAGGGSASAFRMPGAGYWLALAGGLVAALAVVLATLPLLSRLTALDSARFE